MPKQDAQSKPPHRPARRKSKPKFDVPEGVGEPASASWVYRDEAPAADIPPETPPPSPAAAIAETIAAPIAAAIESAASAEPKPARVPIEEFSHQSGTEPIRDSSSSESRNPVLSAAMSLFGMGVGVMQFFASTTVKLVTAPFGIARRLMPD